MGFLAGKKICVVGGTGAFGQAFARMTAQTHNPRRICILSRDEMKQERMAKEFPDFDYLLGDCRDRDRLKRAFWGCDVVIHAAAYKRVDSGESDPMEVVKTNVFGSCAVVEACLDCEVPQAIGISSDKACQPKNLYGASKMTMEHIFRGANVYNLGGSPVFSIVRYGNVLGSTGSVIPLFLKQKAQGVLTVTDERMTRFMLPMEEAVRLVWNAIEAAQPGLFLPVGLPAMKVIDIAQTIAPEAEIKIIGARPGEKLHEVMYENEDGTFYSSDAPARWFTPTELNQWITSNSPQ